VAIYWLGDSTGVLLITPLVFTLPSLFAIRSRAEVAECAALFRAARVACFVIFCDLTLIPVRLHVLAFAVLPFVSCGRQSTSPGGASLSIFLVDH
jgi:integral membrane sensor domain MASE1